MGYDPGAAKSQPGQFIWVTSTLGRHSPHLSWKPLGRINTTEAKQSKTKKKCLEVGIQQLIAFLWPWIMYLVAEIGYLFLHYTFLIQYLFVL